MYVWLKKSGCIHFFNCIPSVYDIDATVLNQNNVHKSKMDIHTVIIFAIKRYFDTSLKEYHSKWFHSSVESTMSNSNFQTILFLIINVQLFEFYVYQNVFSLFCFDFLFGSFRFILSKYRNYFIYMKIINQLTRNNIFNCIQIDNRNNNKI